MNYKVSYWLMRILGVAGILMMLVAGLRNVTALGIAGGALVILGVAQCSLFFNCPHCKRPLKRRNGIPKVCPYCKKKLD